MTGADASSPSVKQKPTASSKSWPGVRMVVATRTSSRWIDIGSSTISSSGARGARAVVEAGGEHRLGAAPGHGPRLPPPGQRQRRPEGRPWDTSLAAGC